MATVLAVDDDARVLDLLEHNIGATGHRILRARSRTEAMTLAELNPVNVVVIDWKLGDADGVETFGAMRQARQQIVGMLTSGYLLDPADVSRAFDAGFVAFLPKPLSMRLLAKRIDAAVLDSESIEVRPVAFAESETTRTPQEFEGMVGTAPAMREVFALISRVAEHTLPVLIQGETGTGKELVARAIHRRSPRARGPFEALNCGAIPEALAEAELFGHERGAFTGAHERHAGLFERASGGTLFLDEVGDLPLALQVKLLRALDTGEVSPVGSRRPLPVDVRVIAATNLDLDDAVRQGRFRQDLYWRLNAARIDVPAVRDRGGDVAVLLEHVSARVRIELRRPAALFSPAARALLLAHDWPGNVREMEQTVRQAVLAIGEGIIEVGSLPARLRCGHLGVTTRDFELPPGMTVDLALRRIRSRLEPAWIDAALRATGGNRARAADALGIDRRTLYDKLSFYGIGQRRSPESGQRAMEPDRPGQDEG